MLNFLASHAGGIIGTIFLALIAARAYQMIQEKAFRDYEAAHGPSTQEAPDEQ